MTEVPALLFGKGLLPVSLPGGVEAHVVRKPRMPVLDHPEGAVAGALACPVGSHALGELARGAKSACIVICDITRPVPNGLLLPPLVRGLLEAGIPAGNIIVLVATGLHRPNLGEELRELVGSDWVLETVRVENHDARDRDDQVDLGRTPRGTPLALNRHFVEADLKIVTGLVEPHFMAGYSGGRKVIAPGIAHEDTIRTFHNAVFMENPMARNCNLQDNPLHEEQLAIVRMLGDVHSVNTVLDDERRLSFVNFGEILASHQEAVDFVRQYAEVSVPRKYRMVVTSSAGYPLDKTYYQTIKGIVGAADILEPGGDLVIASECSEGMGSAEFLHAQEKLVRLGPSGFLEDMRTRTLADIDEWQTLKLAKVLQSCSVHLFAPGLSLDERGWTGVSCHGTWQDLWDSLPGIIPSEVAVIPEGPYVIPVANPKDGG